MITELTPEQIAMQPAHVEHWINRFRNTDSMTDEVIEEGVFAMYKILKRKQPEIFRADSPMACWKLVCDKTGLGKDHYDSIILPGVDGYFEAGFFAVYDYYEKIGVTMPDSYTEYRKTADLNFYWCLDDFCVVCDRPRIIEFGPQGLSNDKGPAVEWRDGSQCWMIDGIEVDEQIVMHPETQTVEQIQGEKNEDVRTLRIDRYGWLKYLGDIKAEVIDERDNKVEGTYEALHTTDLGYNVLVCTCLTGKVPALVLPSTVRTCEEAQLWFKVDPEIDIIART